MAGIVARKPVFEIDSTSKKWRKKTSSPAATTDVPAGLISTVTKSWDSGVALTAPPIFSGNNGIYGELLTASEYDFTGTNPVRTTTNTYMALSGPNASSYLTNNLLSLPYTVKVTSGSGSGPQVAYTTYGYDETR